MSDPRDPLDDLLAPEPILAPTDLRERLRAQTAQHIRRRRRTRRLTRTAAGVGLLVVALGLLWVWFAVRSAWVVPPQTRRQEPPPAPPAPRTPTVPLPPALALEWQAFDSTPEQRPVRYLEAGNEYVTRDDDYEAALRCYRKAFDAGGAAALEINSDDNWLVMAIKLDRRKER